MPKRVHSLLLAGIVVAVVGVGIFVGRQAGAAVNDPGSQGDPLVARSYVDQKIAAILDRLTNLESAVASLQKAQSQPAPSTAAPVSAPAPALKQGSVSGIYVNIRSGPGLNNRIVTTAGRGMGAGVLGSQNGWYNIKLSNGTVGWIAGWLFTVQ